ncbi:uncharacterized protein V1513DRAFT_442575 [Lipomyces chichibuensis]|uniref:uncharacterized protein n=1 Tax=Lipomyces chichibuensis TaxID=1546026 RepID=UPI00334405B7
MWKRKETANTAELFEKNLIRWVVQTKITVIGSPAFVKLFKNIPGVNLPITSHKTSLSAKCGAKCKREPCCTLHYLLRHWVIS